MIENWKKAYKFFSVQLLAVLIVLAGLEPFVPQISELLPEHWVPWFAALILFARLVSQSKKPTDPNVLIEAAARAGATLKKGSVLIVLLACVGCTKADMLKVVNTADDAAKVACSLFFAEHQGISVHDAAKMFCDTREAIDVFLASQKQAGEEMAAAQGLARK